MRILFISALYPPTTKGGGEISTYYIARALAARGHYVKVLTYGPQRTESHIQGVNVVHVPIDLLAKPLFEEWHSKKIASLLRKEISKAEQFDVIHAHDFRSALALACLKLPNSVVTARDYAQISGCTNNILANGSINPGCADDPLHCHRLAEVSFPRRMARLWQYEYNIGFRHKAFQSFPKQIFISHAEETEILRHQKLPNVQTTVIYNPIPPEYLQQMSSAGQARLLLYVGRVEMYKGVGLLLEAFREIAAQDTNVHLNIVGEGAQKDFYEQLVAQWGLQYRVTFKNHVPYDRLMPVYDEAEIVVAPHLWIEPFGRSAVEAMARGKIVVAANSGGPAEIIQSKQNGYLFERGNKQALVHALLEALATNHYDKREMGQKAQAWVKEHLLLDTIASQHEAFYIR